MALTRWYNRGHQADQLYQEKRLPFASLCSLLGKPVLEVWRAYTEDDSKSIFMGSGTDEETDNSSSLLRDADSVLMDSLALFTAYSLGLGAHLRKRFQQVAVPQFVFDELLNYYATQRTQGPAAGYLGKGENGRYSITEVSEEFWSNLAKILEFSIGFCRIFRAISSLSSS